VDDGSPDDIFRPIADLLNEENRLTYVRKENGGVASARNFGALHLADVEFIMFLDGDDELTPFALEKMVSILEAFPDAGMAHCDPDFIDEQGMRILDRSWLPRWGARGGMEGAVLLGADDLVTPFESVYTLAGIIPSLSLFRRSVYEQTPGYDEAFGQHFEDTDLNLQMAIRAPVRYLPEKLVRYRIRSGQSSGDLNRHRTQATKLYAKWRLMPNLTAEQRKIVAMAEAFRTGPHASHIGFQAARRHAREGDWLMAFRFWQGAVRRRVASGLKTPFR
jgi:glycosyltransferase involved in cell wall biosynthesis